MPDLLGVTNPVPGLDSQNVNRNIPVSPNNTQIQNAPDPSRVSRPDNRSERQDSGEQAGGGAERALRYDSNYQSFLQRMSDNPDMMRSMMEIFRILQGTVVNSGMGEGIAGDMSALMQMLEMDEKGLTSFFKDQLEAENRFSGPLFNLLREAFGGSSSEVLRGSILQFLKRYNDYTSRQHIQGNLLRNLTQLTRSIPASYGNRLLPMVSDLEAMLMRGDRQGALKMLQGKILPFLSNYTSRTNDMGLSRMLISMLALDVARFENGSKEGLLQSFHQLSAHSAIRERLGNLSDEALMKLIDSGGFAKAAEKDAFAEQLARTAQRAIRGGAGTEAQESFRNILSAFLVNESVFMPLNHMILPLLWNGRMAFSEVWVDPDAEENLKQGRGERDNVIRFLFKIDIQELGFFDMVLTCQRENVDVQLFCPDSVSPFSELMGGDLAQILTDNGLQANNVQVQPMQAPLPISSVFPQIFRGGSGVDVKA
ncbi:MAG: hypothetical protein HFF73_07655 [Oscillospiraceae bacterium]|nr:hypothetical protein [Oscillospiraceae bacterium]